MLLSQLKEVEHVILLNVATKARISSLGAIDILMVGKCLWVRIFPISTLIISVIDVCAVNHLPTRDTYQAFIFAFFKDVVDISGML